MDLQIQKMLKGDATSADRLDTYHHVIKILQDEKEIPTVLLKNAAAVFTLLKQDITCEHVKISQDSLYFLGVLLSQPAIISCVDSKKLNEVLDDICNVIRTSNEKAICTRALWCLTKQKMPKELYVEKVVEILNALEHASQTFSSMSVSVEMEGIRVLNRLLIELPDKLAVRSGMWARRLYLSTLHPMQKIRESALIALTAARPCFEKQQCELLSKLISDLKETLVPGMLKLFKDKQELHVLKLWNVLLDILGKTLHQGATLINNLLAVVEKAFKSPTPEVKIAAFKCWQHLIDNFGTELDVLANPKRLRLVMQPLKANNARAESIAVVKFNVWWHLAINLGSKLPPNTEMVLYPLLQLCFGLTDPAQAKQINASPSNGVNLPQTSASTPKLNTSSLAACSSPGLGQSFPSIHRLGCEALAQILGHELSLTITRPPFTIGGLSHPVISPPSLFLRHAKILLLATKEAIMNLSAEKKDLHLQLYLWHSAIALIRNVAETENIKDVSETVSIFLSIIEEFVKSNKPPPEVTLKLLETTTTLPQRMLTSSALNISSASVMHGTPALFLVTLLFNPSILKLSSSQERFMGVFQKLVMAGVASNTSPLGFIHSVVKTLESVTPEIEQSETLYQLWSTIVFPLLENIQKNQEVNQGDALEHDFSCLYATLLYPIRHLLSKPLLQNSFKTLLRTWGDLYRTFASCAALVSTTEGNVCCEELASSISSLLTSKDLENVLFVDNLSQLIMIMMSSVDFTPVSIVNANSSAVASPSLWMKRRQKPLGNLTALTSLIEKLFNAVLSNQSSSSATNESGDAQLSSNITLFLKVINTLVEIIRHLYSDMTSSNLIGPVTVKLAPVLAKLFSDPSKRDVSKLQQGQLMTKLETLWNTITNCIQMHFNGPYDSDFLASISPLLEETLLYPRKNIRVKTRMLWHSTFAQTCDTLNYPDSLKSVLRKIKPSLVPGYTGEDDEMLDDTQATNSDENMQTGQESEKISSPQKINSSLSIKKSAPVEKSARTEDEPATAVVSNKRPRIDDDDEKEFVKILPEVKKRRILTDHQKEVLSTRSDIPALYNELSQSQDVNQLPSQFMDDAESQQSINIPKETPVEVSSAKDDTNSDKVAECSVNSKVSVDVENESATKPPDTDITNLPSSDDSVMIVDSVNEVAAEGESKIDSTSKTWENSVEIIEGETVVSTENASVPVQESQSLLDQSPAIVQEDAAVTDKSLKEEDVTKVEKETVDSNSCMEIELETNKDVVMEDSEVMVVTSEGEKSDSKNDPSSTINDETSTTKVEAASAIKDEAPSAVLVEAASALKDETGPVVVSSTKDESVENTLEEKSFVNQRP